MEEEKELALRKPDRTSTDLAVFSSIEGFEVAQRMAKALYTSTMVPETYRGEKNLGSCLIALDLSARLGLNPLMVMQNLYVVKGKPSFSGQFLIGLINSSGLYKSKLKFEQVGEVGKDTYGYRAYAIDHDGDKVYGPAVTMRMAVGEGWWNTNMKWQTMTELMIRYRAGALFARTNCPEITFGFQTIEEVEDLGGKVVDIPPHEVQEIDPTQIPVSEAKPIQEAKPVAEAKAPEAKTMNPAEQDF